jgi:hypothetical protein
MATQSCADASALAGNLPISAQSSAARWLALLAMCVGCLMTAVDGTIVAIALPSIKTELGFSDASLAWVVESSHDI